MFKKKKISSPKTYNLHNKIALAAIGLVCKRYILFYFCGCLREKKVWPYEN